MVFGTKGQVEIANSERIREKKQLKINLKANNEYSRIESSGVEWSGVDYYSSWNLSHVKSKGTA